MSTTHIVHHVNWNDAPPDMEGDSCLFAAARLIAVGAALVGIILAFGGSGWSGRRR